MSELQGTHKEFSTVGPFPQALVAEAVRCLEEQKFNVRFVLFSGMINANGLIGPVQLLVPIYHLIAEYVCVNGSPVPTPSFPFANANRITK
jgi:hypothetical protein